MRWKFDEKVVVALAAILIIREADRPTKNKLQLISLLDEAQKDALPNMRWRDIGRATYDRWFFEVLKRHNITTTCLCCGPRWKADTYVVGEIDIFVTRELKNGPEKAWQYIREMKKKIEARALRPKPVRTVFDVRGGAPTVTVVGPVKSVMEQGSTVATTTFGEHDAHGYHVAALGPKAPPVKVTVDPKAVAAMPPGKCAPVSEAKPGQPVIGVLTKYEPGQYVKLGDQHTPNDLARIIATASAVMHDFPRHRVEDSKSIPGAMLVVGNMILVGSIVDTSIIREFQKATRSLKGKVSGVFCYCDPPFVIDDMPDL